MQETKGTKEDRKEAILKRTKGAWELIFGLLGIAPTNDPISIEALRDAGSPETQAVMMLYSLEFWLFAEFNKANKTKINGKLLLLGPFATILSVPMDHAQVSRL